MSIGTENYVLEDIEVRRTDLIAAVKSLIAGRDQWVESDSATVQPGDDFWEACDQMAAIWETGAIPSDFRELMVVVQSQWLLEWTMYRDRVSESRDPYAQPSERFFAAIEDLERRIQRQEEPPPASYEPLATLLEQKVSPQQICKIYGWENPDGSVQYWKLDQEIATPGTHLNDSYVPPHVRRWQQRDSARQHAVAEARRRLEYKLSRSKDSGDETIEDLLQQNVSLPQLAKIKRMSESQVVEYCQERNLPLPAQKYDPVETAKSPYDREPNEAEQRILDAQSPRKTAADESVKERILELRAEGRSVRTISSVLATEGVEIPWQAVSSVLRAAGKTAE